MTTIAELLAQQKAIEDKIAELRKTQTAEAIAKAQAIIAEHGLSQFDVFPSSRSIRVKDVKEAKERKPVAAKYRDPVTGKTWSGRGIAPKWLEGKDRAQFAI